MHKAFVHSSLFRAACLRLNLFDYGIQEDPVRWNQQAIGDNNVVQALPRLKALAMHHGFQTMIVIWPRFTDDEILDLHSIPESPRRISDPTSVPYACDSYSTVVDTF